MRLAARGNSEAIAMEPSVTITDDAAFVEDADYEDPFVVEPSVTITTELAWGGGEDVLGQGLLEARAAGADSECN